jgi:anti-sigma28 factor (negative regulator of flagellin synthesis)
MKIEGNRPSVDATATGQVDAARVAASKAKELGAAQKGDAVTVSSDVALAQKAIDAASEPVAVRPEAVARGKALLESGKLGADAHKLADALIQSLMPDKQG